MNKLVLRKEETTALSNYLQEIALKNKLSRLRNKLINKLNAVNQEMEEDRVALAKEHSKRDDKNEPIVENGVYIVKDQEEFTKELHALVSEEVAIEIGEYSNNFDPLFEFLDSEAYDVELSGLNANCYDRLLEVWENAKEPKEVEKK